jgi:hypothetical protein
LLDVNCLNKNYVGSSNHLRYASRDRDYGSKKALCFTPKNRPFDPLEMARSTEN